LVLLTKNGFDRFAYVPNAGLIHKHVSSIIELAKKRIRNVKKVYLLHVDNKLFVWVDLSRWSNVLKLLLWIMYANAVIPSILTGVYKSIKHRDLAGLYEPVVNVVITDVIIWSFLTSHKGRNLFLSAANKLLKF
jgi:hypothetical protein